MNANVATADSRLTLRDLFAWMFAAAMLLGIASLSLRSLVFQAWGLPQWLLAIAPSMLILSLCQMRLTPWLSLPLYLASLLLPAISVARWESIPGWWTAFFTFTFLAMPFESGEWWKLLVPSPFHFGALANLLFALSFLLFLLNRFTRWKRPVYQWLAIAGAVAACTSVVMMAWSDLAGIHLGFALWLASYVALAVGRPAHASTCVRHVQPPENFDPQEVCYVR